MADTKTDRRCHLMATELGALAVALGPDIASAAGSKPRGSHPALAAAEAVMVQQAPD